MRDIVKHKREAKTIKQYEATITATIRRRPLVGNAVGDSEIFRHS